MLLPSDYKGLLRALNAHKVRYLIVGAYAVVYYTEPRYTKDLDIWVEPQEENAQKVYEALKKFGAPLKGISIEDFLNKNLVYQIGVEPVRIDIIMGLSNIDFSFVWKHRKVVDFEGLKINIIGVNELIQTKKDSKRDTDKRDIEALKTKLRLWRG